MLYFKKWKTGTCDSLVTFLSPFPLKKKYMAYYNTCEGVVLLKQWKQGNTRFSKIMIRPLKLGVFFCIFTSFRDFPISSRLFPTNSKDVIRWVFRSNYELL